MNKEKLEILIKLPKQHFDAVIKLINPKVTDEDSEPMFPEGWSSDKNWPAPEKETNAEFWEKWKYHQMRIDEELERQAGC